MRVNMSIAIVDMTDNRNKDSFDWNLKTQSVILSSFFWGYVILQIPGGVMASKFGGKILILIAIFVNAVVCALIPVCAFLGGWELVCACRVMQGLTQAFMYPVAHHLISQWIPPNEKGLLVAMIYSGCQLGLALQLLLGGQIAAHWGWQAIFYVNGAVGAIWSLVYVIFGAASPEQCRYISKEEVLHIQVSSGRTESHKGLPTPWRKILTCTPFWAVCISHCGQNWGYFVLITLTPTFMANILNCDLQTNGTLTSLPYLTAFALSFVMGSLSDLIIRKKWLRVTHSRKLFNSIGLCVPAVSLIGLSFVPKNNMILAVSLLVLTVGVNNAVYVGFMIGHIDLAPNFSGPLMGFTNFLANIVSLIAPIASGAMIKDKKDPKEWRKVFFVASGIYLCVNLVFVIFATAKKQEWNEPMQQK